MTRDELPVNRAEKWRAFDDDVIVVGALELQQKLREAFAYQQTRGVLHGLPGGDDVELAPVDVHRVQSRLECIERQGGAAARLQQVHEPRAAGEPENLVGSRSSQVGGEQECATARLREPPRKARRD